MTVFESLLNHDFTRERRRRTSDGQGGWSLDYTDEITVRGRLRPATSTEREVAASEEREISHVFYCDADEDVKRGDRITGVSAESGRTLVVEVDAIREPSFSGEHLECDCQERQQEETTEVGS